jgi:excisionase family DNA binding protein
MEAEYLTPREVAQHLRVKASTVRRWIYTGTLEAETVQEGGRNRHRIKKVVIEAIERPGFSKRCMIAERGLPRNLHEPRRGCLKACVAYTSLRRLGAAIQGNSLQF